MRGRGWLARFAAPASGASPGDPLVRVLTALLGLGLTIWAFGVLWFVEREPVFDEQGVSNAAYMFGATGHASYPAYPTANSEQSMFVHPPTHYVMLGALMRLTGATFAGAGVTVVLALLVLTVVLAVSTPLPLAARFGALGAVVFLVAWPDPFFIRPDVHAAAAFVAALTALEAARATQWNPFLAAIGGILLALASCLHYPMTPAVGGIAAYAALAWWSGQPQARRAAVAASAGALLVLIPYIALFVVPDFSYIRAFVTSTNASAGADLLAPLRNHRDSYAMIADTMQGGWWFSIPLRPFATAGVPVFLVTTLILAKKRETRAMAVASLPFLLGFTLVASWKGPSGFSGYFAAEFALLYIALMVSIVSVASFVLRNAARGHIFHASTAAAGALSLIALAVAVRPSIDNWGPRVWNPLHADLEIAHAATASMLPPDSLVLTQGANLWHTSGGSRVYMLFRDPWYTGDLAGLDVKGFLASFDAIAESELDTWVTYNKQRASISSWYADGTLTLRGFYFGDRRKEGTSQIRFTLLGVGRQRIIGHALDGDAVLRFEESSGSGSWILVSAECPFGSATLRSPPRWSSMTWLPGRTNLPPAEAVAGGEDRRGILTWIERAHTYDNLRRAQTRKECNLLVEQRMVARSLDARQVLRNERDHWDTEFPQHIDALNILYRPKQPVRIDGNSVQVDRAAVNEGATFSVRRAQTAIETPATTYAYAAAIPLRRGRGDAWVLVKGRVTKGVMGLCVLDRSENRCLTRRVLPANAGGDIYMRLPEGHNDVSLYFDNLTKGASAMLVSEFAVVSPRKR